MMEPPVRIENRTQLAYLLSEAAELEHGIMSCYLFAAFSLKESTAEGITEPQLQAIKGWRDALTDISIQEMLHFGLVNNLLAAIGGAPHVERPNFPTTPAMYPRSFQLALRAFDEETLKYFVFLERPEGMEIRVPGIDKSSGAFTRPVVGRDIFSDRPEYQTVGHLYRGIEDGLRYLDEKLGSERLFIGPAKAQASQFPGLSELEPITDLPKAIAAIQRIVEQGEGARGINEAGHYFRFARIQSEFEEIKRHDPGFKPGRPVMTNPYTRVPGDVADPAGLNLIDDQNTIAMCNLFDGAYELLVQMLERYFSPAEASEAELKVLVDATRRLMVQIIGPLGRLITSLPAGPSHPGMNAGPSFSFARNIHSPPQMATAWTFWRERLMELSGYCAVLESYGAVPPTVSRVGQGMEQIARRIQGVVAR